MISSETEQGAVRARSTEVVQLGQMLLSACSLDQAVDQFYGFLDNDRSGYLTFLAAHSLTQASTDSTFRTINNNALLSLPDGAPIAWLGRMQGQNSVTRVTGPDFFENILTNKKSANYRHFFYGASEPTLEVLKQKVSGSLGADAVAGSYSPPIREYGAQETDEVIAQIESAQPDVIWVGLSTPKQEYWLHNHIARFHRRVIGVGVGAAFDFYSGQFNRAPSWYRDKGFEWLFRLAQEPRRMMPRYLRALPMLSSLALRVVLERGKGMQKPIQDT